MQLMLEPLQQHPFAPPSPMGAVWVLSPMAAACNPMWCLVTENWWEVHQQQQISW